MLLEKYGVSLAWAFFIDCGLSKEEIDRVSYLVGHHHTFSNIDGIDYQILIEADYIANAAESGYTKSSIENALSKIIKTKSATQLILSMFCL